MGHHPIAQAIMWRTVTMMMAEAMAMSASKKTLCLRRSILRMRFIATACRSGSLTAVALSSWAARRSCFHGRRTWRRPRASGTTAPRCRPDSSTRRPARCGRRRRSNRTQAAAARPTGACCRASSLDRAVARGSFDDCLRSFCRDRSDKLLDLVVHISPRFPKTRKRQKRDC